MRRASDSRLVPYHCNECQGALVSAYTQRNHSRRKLKTAKIAEDSEAKDKTDFSRAPRRLGRLTPVVPVSSGSKVRIHPQDSSQRSTALRQQHDSSRTPGPSTTSTQTASQGAQACPPSPSNALRTTSAASRSHEQNAVAELNTAATRLNLVKHLPPILVHHLRNSAILILRSPPHLRPTPS